MARPRIKQFADDLSIDYGKAKNLIEKGRRRSDGGSQTLERNMNKMSGKVKKVSKALKKASKTHAGQAKTLDSIEFQDGGSNRIMTPTPLSQEDILEGLVRRNIARKKEKERQTSRRGGPAVRSKSQNMGSSKPKTYADGGSVNMSRGGGAAVKGTKFSGVY
tara:strand:+ start:35 stop:520 length:486 start_codon:yes stop_codon:yes gene_type:complete